MRSEATGGLLQADIEDKIQVTDGSRSDLVGATLSSGTMIAACPRNVFTISRAKDDDGFADSADVHFGQILRLGASQVLSDRPHYLFASRNRTDDLGQDEALACLYGRAAAGTLWRVVTPGAQAAAPGAPVRRDQRFALESVETGHRLCSDTSVRMNSYGNEWRVFCASAPAEAAAMWTFVDSRWADQVVEASRKAAGHDPAKPDPGELLVNPSARADHELHVLETDAATSDYAVLARVFPQLRRSGMHVARKTMKMCRAADTADTGSLPIHSFEGILSWVAVRLQDGEVQKLLNLFGTEPNGDVISYQRFFAAMGTHMPEVRIGAVRDAYDKLRKVANAGHVEVTDIQRHWNARCHPDVQCGRMSESDARVDFFNQWEVTSADGSVSYEDFLAYYRDLSMAVEKDDLFVEIVRSAWRLHEVVEPDVLE